MFLRYERSIKEFFKLYPIVSILIIIHFSLWLIIDLLQLHIGWQIYTFGVGYNLLVSLGEYWRLFTPIFLHADLTHALFNSFALVLFGPALEQMLGKVKFLLAYFSAGIIGNIGTYFFEPLDYLHLGASGAVYGLLGIYVFMTIYRKDLIDAGSSQVVRTLLIIGILMSFFGGRINIIAHLTGFIGGFIIAPLVLKNARIYNPFRAFERSYPDSAGDIQFDPNRWNKKRIIPRKLKDNWIWIAIGILALIGLLNRL